MNDITTIFISFPTILAACITFSVFYYLNMRVGPVLWETKNRFIRRVLKVLEATKLVYPPLFAASLACIPVMPRPALVEGSLFVSAFVFFVAGIFCTWIVKGVRKALEARGINIDIDDPPKTQIRRNRAGF